MDWGLLSYCLDSVGLEGLRDRGCCFQIARHVVPKQVRVHMGLESLLVGTSAKLMKDYN